MKEENPAHDTAGRTREADLVSARIATLLSERAFSFTSTEYISIHKKLFTGIYSHAGIIRFITAHCTSAELSMKRKK